MHKLLNFFSFPVFLIGSILLSNGILSYDFNKNNIQTTAKTSSQVNNLYSEKEITLKDPPVSEVLI